MSLLSGQDFVSPQRGLPVDDKGASTKTVTAPSETVQLYYYAATGVKTIDAGQAAGVTVVGKLSNDNVRNAMGSAQAVMGDTSLAFTCTALTTEVPFSVNAASLDGMTAENRAKSITANFSNGEYCVDYASGMIYAKKASTAVTMTSVTYIIGYNTTGGGTIITSDINIDQVGGTATATGAGNTDAGTQRIVIATNQAAVPVSFSATVKSTDDSAALEASTVTKASAGTIYSVTGYNAGVEQFIQIHDASSLPADTAVPEISFIVGAGENFFWEEEGGRPMATGIVVCNSSTQATKTIGGATCWFNITYV